MNANELIDELSWSEMDTDEIETWTKEAVTMLRQQQAEIQNLKAGLLSHNDIYYEPTAWINHIKQTGGDFYELNVSGRGEPLYRHPPQTKPLSDEEILNSWVEIDLPEECWITDEQLINFARAIEERHGIK